MSTSVHVSAIKPPDEVWQKHKTVWEACEAAGVEIPDATHDYFDGEAPDQVGVEVRLGDIPAYTSSTEHACVRRYSTEYSSGLEVDVTLLPKGTRYVRVVWG